MTTQVSQTNAPEGYVYVCDRADVPARGKKTVHLNDVTVLIVACNGGLYAIEDRCPQTGRSLAHGRVLRCDIISPYNGVWYCLKTGRCLSGGGWPLPSNWLRVFAVQVVDEKVYVRLPDR